MFQQVFEQLKQLIESGDILPGEQFPSTRKLAETLGVNRSTVYRAYEELWAAGYLESTSGAYSRVRQRSSLAEQVKQPKESSVNWDECISDAVNRIDKISSNTGKLPDGIVNFRPLSPDSNLLPVEDFRHCLNKVLQTEGADLLQYGNPLGYEPLRHYLAKQMREIAYLPKVRVMFLLFHSSNTWT